MDNENDRVVRDGVCDRIEQQGTSEDICLECDREWCTLEGQQYRLKLRNMMIQDRAAGGETIEKIATDMHMHKRTIASIVKRRGN